MLTAAVAAWAQPETRGYQRWAVIAAPELQQAGVADLVVATLSAAGVELVERDQIAQVTRELATAQVMGDDAAGQRLRLGQLLKADALLILSRDGTDKSAATRLVVAECVQGARLHVQEFAAEAAGELPRHCASIVAAIRQRFPQGVTRLVAVPNFMSRDLAHDHNAWQARYADLLAGSLALQPGLAVVAIDEARAISRELSIGGQGLGQRRLPVIVEGEFRTQLRNAGTPPAVTLTIQLKSEAGEERISSGELSLPDSPQWIATVLAPRVLRLAQGGEPMSVEAQAAAMERRADEFARMGAHEYSTRLREAVLLLTPQRTEQHRALFEDWLALARRNLVIPKAEQRPDNPRLIQGAARKVDAYVNALEHLEMVIRKTPIQVHPAMILVDRVRPASVFYGTMPVRVDVIGGVWFLAQEHLGRAEDTYRDFLVRMTPVIAALPNPPDPQFITNPLSLLQGQLFALSRRIDRDYCTAEDLAFVLRVQSEIEPEGLPVSGTGVIKRVNSGGFRQGEASEAQYDALYRAMASSKRPIVALRGRILLLLDRHAAAGDDREALRALLPEFEQVLADYRNLRPTLPRFPPPEKEMLYTNVARTARDIEIALGLRQPDVRPTAPQPVQRTTGAVRFEPINLTLKRRTGQISPMPQSAQWPTPQGPRPWRAITRCGDSLDAWWGEGVVLFMRKPGLLEEVILDTKANISDLAWDGRHIWLATRSAGIVVLDQQGKIVDRINRDAGLPPADEMLLLAPVGEGKVLAAGGFGSPHRGWCAIITRTAPGAVDVRVIHEAVNVPPPGFNPLARDPIDVGFVPSYIHIGDGPPESRLIVVGRLGAMPLRVDPASMTVSQLTTAPDARAQPVMYSGNGCYITTVGFSMYFEPIPGQPVTEGMARQRIAVTNPAPVDPTNDYLRRPESVNHVIYTGSFEPRLLLDGGDGWQYLLSHQWWYRIDPKTRKAQRLTSTWMPSRFQRVHGFMTAHYGMVVRTVDSAAHKVTIDEDAIPAAGTPMHP